MTRFVLALLPRLAAVLLLLVLFREAFAQDHNAHPYYPNSGAALAACNAHRTSVAYQYFPGQQGPCNDTGIKVNHLGHDDIRVEWRITHSNQAVQWSGSYPDVPNTCGTKPPLGENAVRGSSTMCKDGCSYSMGGNGVCIGGNDYCFATSWNPTGAQCSEGPDADPNHQQNKEVCTNTGGYSHCFSADGKQCVISGRGTRMCWMPGETGARMTADGAEGAARTVNGNPATPPPAMQNPQATGSTTSTVNNTTYNTTTYTGSGSSGGQSNTGTGGKDPGPGGDSGDGSDDENSPGAPSGVGGDLYEGSGDTVESVLTAYFARIGASPIASAFGSFFDVNISGGACPVWTVPESDWMPAFTFDLFCDSALTALLEAAGLVMLIVAAAYAFHIAIGD